MVILQAMDDERKPKDDLKEGLGLIFRAAKGAAKRVDMGKIDKELDKAISQVGRVVTSVGRVVGDEIGRMANNPPWQKGGSTSAADAATQADASVPDDKEQKEDKAPAEGESKVRASAEPSGEKGGNGAA
jgi:hypothetical protein